MEKIEEIIENFEFLDNWEDKYLYIIDLGKKLPEFEIKMKTPANIVEGCQSRVWVVPNKFENNRLYFEAESDSQIVKGLVAIVLSCFNDKTPSEIVNFDINSVFKALDLESNLSGNRSNGLKAMVAKIKTIAKNYL